MGVGGVGGGDHVPIEWNDNMVVRCMIKTVLSRIPEHNTRYTPTKKILWLQKCRRVEFENNVIHNMMCTLHVVLPFFTGKRTFETPVCFLRRAYLHVIYLIMFYAVLT